MATETASTPVETTAPVAAVETPVAATPAAATPAAAPAPLVLYTFGEAFHQDIDASPFVFKLACYLHYSQIEFVKRPLREHRMEKSPKKKMPYIEVDGKVIADSNIIMEYFKTTRGIDYNKNLTPVELAISQAFKRMIEEELYWSIFIHPRWIVDKNWEKTKGCYSKNFLGENPGFIMGLVTPLALSSSRSTIIKSAYSQGVGRFTNEEVQERSLKDVKAISQFLGEKQFFFGDEISEIDFTVYAFMKGALDDGLEDQTREFIKTSNLSKYIERLDDLLLPKKEVKQEEVKQEEVKQEEVKQEEVKQEEVKQEEVKEEEVKQEEVKQEEVKQEEVKQEEVKEEEIKQEEAKEEEAKEEEKAE